MPSDTEINENELSAEERFRNAFNRLKNNEPKVLAKGTPVSQNNVAKEARKESSALRKDRFPSLIREIQAYVEIHKNERPSKRQKRLGERKKRQEHNIRLREVEDQRDDAQSKLASANRRIIELYEELQMVRMQYESLRPPPSPLPL